MQCFRSARCSFREDDSGFLFGLWIIWRLTMTLTQFNQIIASTHISIVRVVGIDATSYVTATRQCTLLDSLFPTDAVEQQELADWLLATLELRLQC